VAPAAGLSGEGGACGPRSTTPRKVALGFMRVSLVVLTM
jgi:hypothetical protein